MNIGAIAVAFSTLVMLVYSGLLFDPNLIRSQLGASSLREFGILALANYVVIPVLTLGLIRICGFPPVLNLVLLTMALMPCASMVPAMVSLAGEPAERPLFVLLFMSVLNVLIVPLLMDLLTLPWVAGSDAELNGGEGAALAKYVISVFGPMSLGAAIRVFAPRHYPWIERWLRQAVKWLMFGTFPIFVYSYRAELLALSWRDLFAFILLELICIAVALLFVPHGPHNRIATLLICGMRNVTMAIAFVVFVFPHTPAALSYMLAFTSLLFMGVAIALGIRKRLAASAI